MKRFLSTFLAIVVLFLAGIVLYYLLVDVWSTIGKVSANVGAAIIAAVATATVAIYNQRASRLHEISESHRVQKVELYGVFMDIIDTIMDLSKQGQLGQITEGSLPGNLEDLMKTFRRGLLVWASPEVIRAWEDMRASGTSGIAVLRKADGVFRAIRKDLGNSNWGLAQGGLIKLFLKDPSEYDRMLRGRATGTSIGNGVQK
jgi:hypothetical protein